MSKEANAAAEKIVARWRPQNVSVQYAIDETAEIIEEAINAAVLAEMAEHVCTPAVALADKYVTPTFQVWVDSYERRFGKLSRLEYNIAQDAFWAARALTPPVAQQEDQEER